MRNDHWPTALNGDKFSYWNNIQVTNFWITGANRKYFHDEKRIITVYTMLGLLLNGQILYCNKQVCLEVSQSKISDGVEVLQSKISDGVCELSLTLQRAANLIHYVVQLYPIVYILPL